MNDDELERRLRSERGPREAGYAAGQLPASLDSKSDGRPPRPVRVGLYVGAALAAALAVAVAGSILSGESPGVGGDVSPSVAASVSGSPAATAGDGNCQAGDLFLTEEAWGGAAGSRGTVVTVALADGHASCMLPASVTMQIVDGTETTLVSGQTTTGRGQIQLVSGQAYTIGVAWSNWCGSLPADPLSLVMSAANWPAVATVVGRDRNAVLVPPCLGDTPTSLSVTEFQTGLQ
jgi:hypothetical protein